jgi:hypothetical protein
LIRLLRSGFALALLLGIALLAMNLVVESTVRRSEPAFRLYEAISDPQVRPKIVILGDSRSALDVALDSDNFDVFNWSEVGEGMRQTLLKADYVLRTKTSVRAIVLPVDDYVLSGYRAANSRWAASASYANPELLRRFLGASTARIWRNRLAFALPVLDHETRLILRDHLALRADQTIGYPRKGAFTRLDDCLDLRFAEEVDWVNEPEERRVARTVARMRAQYPADLVVDEMVVVLRTILESARRHGVSVVGVRHPISNEYIAVAGERDVSAVRAAIAGLPFRATLDYVGLFADRQELFNDMDHLRRSGAREFTAIMLRELATVVGENVRGSAGCAARKPPRRLWPVLEAVSDLLREGNR